MGDEKDCDYEGDADSRGTNRRKESLLEKRNSKGGFYTGRRGQEAIPLNIHRGCHI